MDYLLDTHALIWFMNGDQRISSHALNIIRNKKNRCFVSIASIWEIAIKLNIGKLDIKVSFNEIFLFLSDNELQIIPIEFNHLSTLLTLDLIHRDPFDRVLISQANSENLTVLTTDEIFNLYPVRCEW